MNRPEQHTNHPDRLVWRSPSLAAGSVWRPSSRGRRRTPILPAMRLAAALETTRIPRVAGRPGARPALATARSFRGPPHTFLDVER
jgi:hypothetical protein